MYSFKNISNWCFDKIAELCLVAVINGIISWSIGDALDKYTTFNPALIYVLFWLAFAVVMLLFH